MAAPLLGRRGRAGRIFGFGGCRSRRFRGRFCSRAWGGFGSRFGRGFGRRLRSRFGRRSRCRLGAGLGLSGLRRGLGVRSLSGGLGRGRLCRRRFGGRRRRKRKIRIRGQQIVQFLVSRFPFGRRFGSGRGGRQHRIPHIRHERRQVRIQSGFDIVIRRRTCRRGGRTAAHIAQQILHRVPGGGRRSRFGRCVRRAAAHITQQILQLIPCGSRGRFGRRSRRTAAHVTQQVLHRVPG